MESSMMRDARMRYLSLASAVAGVVALKLSGCAPGDGDDGSACVTNADCSTDNCFQGTCQGPADGGQPCMTNGGCASGTCTVISASGVGTWNPQSNGGPWRGAGGCTSGIWR